MSKTSSNPKSCNWTWQDTLATVRNQTSCTPNFEAENWDSRIKVKDSGIKQQDSGIKQPIKTIRIKQQAAKGPIPSTDTLQQPIGPRIQFAFNPPIVQPQPATPITSLVHPTYDQCLADWQKWRLVYEGGDRFIEEYLQKFSKRETTHDFRRRKLVTPIPAFAESSITEIKNAIFQRTVDVTRKGGPETYQQAVLGQLQGVDLKLATMNWFIGHNILEELLTMKKVGVYVDMKDPGKTVAQKANKHPYFYTYQAENIRNWAYGSDESEFTSLLLKEYNYVIDPETNLPVDQTEVYRRLWIADDGYVRVQLYDRYGNAKDAEIMLGITKIPFVVFEISHSLLKNVANHQIALLNMESADVSYALKGNFPFYIEQTNNANSSLLKRAQAEFAEHNPHEETAEEIEVGASIGRKYPLGAHAPAFINPSSEPLKISMEKQKALKEDIRTLVQLALASIQPKMASAESKALDQSGLESGLSYIGLELEHGEQLLAQYWSMYEGVPQTATVMYPKQWSLKTKEEINAEVKDLKSARDDIPSKTFKKEANKRMSALMLGNNIPSDTQTTIDSEIEKSPGATSDPKIINLDMESGILGQTTAANLRSYPDSEVAAASEDHAARLSRIAAAQTGTALKAAALKQEESNIQNPAARGLPDLSGSPAQDAAQEKINKPQRGQGA